MNFELTALVCVTILWTSSSTVEAKGGRVIGGFPAHAGQFRFAAAINVQTASARHFCTGGLLSDRLVITSGNCVNNATLFTIHLGLLTLDDPIAEILSTSDYLLHPDFDADTITADIGLIKFRIPVLFTDYIYPLSTYELIVNASTNVYILGWGQTSDSDSELSNVLQYANVTVLNHDTCRLYYGSQVTEDMVCVEGNYNEGTCIGDNGGPLFIVDVLSWVLGVSSFISGNGCESSEPSGYTRTYPYLDWIRDELFRP